MAVEYSYPLTQTIAVDDNVLFLNGDRACRKGYVVHNDNSGIFRLKGVNNCGRTIYKVQFNANIAITTGGTVEPISVAITQNGETLNNAVATVTPAAIGDFGNVSIATFIEIPCGCCDTISVKNISATTGIDAINSNLIIDRVA